MKSKNQNYSFYCRDRLYQKVGLTDNDLRLIQTREMARLREISLSAIPTWTIPMSVCASKFEHSIGVGHLARIVTSKPEFREIKRDLYFASLAHDLSTPPFSHLSESFMVKLLGLNHEEFIDVVLDGSEFAEEVKRQGGLVDRISAYVKGSDKPYSDLVNGSIDIDNLDNTLRYALSTGLTSRKFYAPERLAGAYFEQDGQLKLRPKNPADLRGWEDCRRETYNSIYRPYNLSAGMMIWRAIYLAVQEDEIDISYFLKTDAQAYIYLEDRCNWRTKQLMEDARRWKYYTNVFCFTTLNPSDKLQTLVADSWNRGVLADQICHEFSIPQEKVSVFTGKDKGVKQIHLPIVDKNGNHQIHIPQQGLTYIVQVYVHPSLINLTSRINEYMKSAIGE